MRRRPALSAPPGGLEGVLARPPEDRYEILALLGAGGTGQVYRAHDAELGRDVALKILRGDDPGLFERAQREARHQARVDHANVGHIYEVGVLGGKPFVAMQLVEGRTLVEARREMALADKVEAMRQVAEGVQAAHSRGLIHRDLKPGNILVEKREEGWHPWVVDFGLALDPTQPGMTATGDLVGTAAYMAPEQVRGERSRLDRRSDVYALGATFFELLTGRPPFVGGNPVEVLMQALQDDPPALRSLAPALPPELETIVAKCLEKDPERRYPSARLLAEDLERYLRGEPVLAQAPSRLYRWRKAVSRHRLLAGVVAAAAVLVLVSLGIALRARWQAGKAALFAQELGREAEQVAVGLHIAQLAPRHDLAAEKEALRRRVVELEAGSRRLGPPALRPGLVAAGRALLALGDLEGARRRLDEASSLGGDDPELSRARGWVLGRLYRRRLASIRRLDPRWRRAELARERETLLEPALAELARIPPGNARDRAFVALLEGDLESAEAASRAAVAELPWDHRPLLLLAEILSERAHVAFEAGRSDSVAALAASAEEILQAAREIGRSDPRVYRQECALTELRFEIELLGSLPAKEDLDALLEPCDLAVATDSGSAVSLARRAGLRRHLASRAMRRGGDPLEHLVAAIADGERALDLDPVSTDALYQAGVAYSLRANHAVGSDEEISRDLSRAGDLLGRCVEGAPKFIPCRVSLGVNRLELGIHLDNRGRASEPEFVAAVAAFEAALDLAPEVPVLHNNLGYSTVYLAEVLLGRNVDPRPRLERARPALRRAAELAPAYASARLSLGESYRVEARFLRARGGDPTGAVDRADRAYVQALELDPRRYYAAYSRMPTQLILVDFLLDAGDPAERPLRIARTALADAERIHGEPLPCAQAEILIREGRQDANGDAWRRALGLASDACPLTRALAWRWLASWQERHRRNPEASVRSGLLAVDAALLTTPGSAEAYALRAQLELQRARGAGDARAAREAAQRATASWDRALELFPVAEPLWSGEIAEARRILATG